MEIVTRICILFLTLIFLLILAAILTFVILWTNTDTRLYAPAISSSSLQTQNDTAANTVEEKNASVSMIPTDKQESVEKSLNVSDEQVAKDPVVDLPVCDPGLSVCGSQCVDITTSMDHCGQCGRACQLANATAQCHLSLCSIQSCNEGWSNCDGLDSTGCETHLSTSVVHCGDCGNTCSFPRATSICDNGKCAIGTCDNGYENCSGDTSAGCETKTNGSDVLNCGGCGFQCPAGGMCQEGKCMAPPGQSFNRLTNTYDSICPAGQLLHPTTNICVVASQCQADSTLCSGGQICVEQQNGVYGCTCPADTTMCHGTCLPSVPEGSECGACNQNACDLPNTTSSVCQQGQCQIGQCAPHYANCDGNQATGCETNLWTNVKNCGECGKVCEFGHGYGTCVEGVCVLVGCQSGYSNCNGSTECTINTTSDSQHCGSCNSTCNDIPHASSTCLNSQCTIAQCDLGYENCDGNMQTGCESYTVTDPQNCGGCGRTCPEGAYCSDSACFCPPCTQLVDGMMCAPIECPAGSQCMNGACVPSGVCNQGSNRCLPPFVCENHNDGLGYHCVCPSNTTLCNGFCVDTTSDPSNCSACGSRCDLPNALQTACNGSQCQVIQCVDGYGQCESNQVGCETNLARDNQHCGVCNRACPAGTVCRDGECGE